MRAPNHRIAVEVQQVLDVPLYKSEHPVLGAKILRAVLDTIKAALRRHETVRINGFGMFKVVKRKPKPTPGNYLVEGLISDTIQYHSPKHYVIFQPALPLLAMLNLPEDGHEPNATERRAQKRWRRNED